MLLADEPIILPGWDMITWAFFPQTGELIPYCERYGSGRPIWDDPTIDIGGEG